MAHSPEERAHWRDVLRAFDGYMQYHLSANHARRMAFFALPRESRAMFDALGYRDKLEAVDEGIRRNAEFIDLMIQDPVFADMLAEAGDDSSHSHSHSHSDPHSHGTGVHAAQHDMSGEAGQTHSHSHSHDAVGGHTEHSHNIPSQSHQTHPSRSAKQAANDTAQDKVRSVLRSFVRDWAAEGAPERAAAYDPILAALAKAYPDPRTRGKVKVLVPGCGLGRLAMEIAAQGFWAQGNEFSAYMLIASHFALNQTTRPEEHQLFPYLHSFSNHFTTGAHLLRSARVPDVVPADILEGRAGGFSLVAGDFEEIYGPAHWFDHTQGPGGGDAESDDEDSGNINQKGRWGAVVTCFFIDTARNVLNYLRIIHGLLADGGVWINLGPLLWHFENSPTPSAKGEGSIELSLDEVKELARMVGFDIHDERMVQSTYTSVPDGMLQHVYNCAFWTATKRADATPEAAAEAETL